MVTPRVTENRLVNRYICDSCGAIVKEVDRVPSKNKKMKYSNFIFIDKKECSRCKIIHK